MQIQRVTDRAGSQNRFKIRVINRKTLSFADQGQQLQSAVLIRVDLPAQFVEVNAWKTLAQNGTATVGGSTAKPPAAHPVGGRPCPMSQRHACEAFQHESASQNGDALIVAGIGGEHSRIGIGGACNNENVTGQPKLMGSAEVDGPED